MNALELFSGTHSVGKVLEEKGYNVISVDICDYKGKYPPTHKINILQFDYKQYPKNYFQIVWASPPCIYYSNLQNCWIGREKKNGEILTKESLELKRKEMDKLVMKSKEIIDYFKPEKWFIENPQTGNLRTRDVVKGLPYYDVDYCSYGFLYKKRTRIWTNVKNFKPQLCKKELCHAMIRTPESKNLIHVKNCGRTLLQQKAKRYHAHTFSKNKNTPLAKTVGGGTNRLERYRIPPKLIEDLISTL